MTQAQLKRQKRSMQRLKGFLMKESFIASQYQSTAQKLLLEYNKPLGIGLKA